MGAKYALWVTLQLMAEIFYVKSSSAVVWICIWASPSEKDTLKMLSMLSSPNLARPWRGSLNCHSKQLGRCVKQSTYPNGIGSQRNSGSLSLAGFVFTSCWRLFGHVLKFWSFWQTTAFISEDFFIGVSYVFFSGSAEGTQPFRWRGRKQSWMEKRIHVVFISPRKRSNALGLGTFGMSRFTEVREIGSVWLCMTSRCQWSGRTSPRMSPPSCQVPWKQWDFPST